MKLTRFYKIIDINNKCYIGKTTETLDIRLEKHKINKKSQPTCSSKLLDLEKCIIIELKLIIPKNKQHIKDIERSFIRSCPNCVNIYLKNDPKPNTEYAKKTYYKHHEKNKLKRLEHSRKNKHISKKYYENNGKIARYNKSIYNPIIISKKFIVLLKQTIKNKIKIIKNDKNKLPKYKLNKIEIVLRKKLKKYQKNR